MTTTPNPLSRYNAARREYDRLNGLAVNGMADWENANPRPHEYNADALDAWLDAWAIADTDIRADLGTDAARRKMIAAEHGLIGWMAVETADQINAHTEAAEIHRLFDLMNAGAPAVRNRTRARLLSVALRYARGRLSG